MQKINYQKQLDMMNEMNEMGEDISEDDLE